MSPKQLFETYLQQTRVMQLATSLDGEMWCCNVHFCSDEDNNLYWMSAPNREHSQHIADNPQVAAALLVHQDTADEKYIIGVSIAGNAECIGNALPENLKQDFIKKLDKDPQLIKDVADGTNPHQFYRLRPTKVVVFDTKNIMGNPRVEVEL